MFNKKERPMVVEPKLPPAPTLSRRAASVAQEMEKLEGDLADAIHWGKDQENRALVAESLLSDAKAEIEKLKAELNHLNSAHNTVIGYMESGAHIFVQCLNYRKAFAERQPRLEKNEAQALEAVAKSVEDQDVQDVLNPPHSPR